MRNFGYCVLIDAHLYYYVTMSVLNYYSLESEIDQSTLSEADPSIREDDGTSSLSSESDATRSSELPTEHERPSLGVNGNIARLTLAQVTGTVSSGSSSLSDISESEDDPSLPLPLNSHIRDVRIRQGPYRPVLRKYKVTVHRGKSRSFCSKWYDFHDWLEYSPKVDRMFCFVCRVFAHKVIGNVGRVDPALPHLELKLVVGKMLEKSFHDTKPVQFINKPYCIEKILEQWHQLATN